MLLIYLDWPKVPEYFHKGIYNCADMGMDWHQYHFDRLEGNFGSYVAERELHQWLRQSIKPAAKLHYDHYPLFIQAMMGEQPWHKDGRDWAINYVIDPGGNDVETVFRQGIDTYRLKIEPERWHLLPYVGTLEHRVEQLETRRLALTLNLWWRNHIYL